MEEADKLATELFVPRAIPTASASSFYLKAVVCRF
jgi:hypothetical protein